MVKRLEDTQGHCTVVISERQIETMRYYFTLPYSLFLKYDNSRQVVRIWSNRDSYPQLVKM